MPTALALLRRLRPAGLAVRPGCRPSAASPWPRQPMTVMAMATSGTPAAHDRARPAPLAALRRTLADRPATARRDDP
ncbi:hypothetical protein ABT370_32520, partial [Streptomyces rubradiris]|uniref:hypothetical protein n=1 Tax=Streptomyces rubradiris TaxID=285531 RepID=UPI0033198CB7